MQGVHLRKYGVEAKIDFELYEVDGVDFRVDAVDAGSDCSVMKDEGAEAPCTNDFVDEGKGYSLTLTATEMEAARVVIYVVDSAAKVWLDKAIVIETYGHASAQHAMDFDDSVRAGLTALPNAAADAAGGLPISDAGGLALDTKLANTNEVTVARMGALTDWINAGRLDLLIDAIKAKTDNLPGSPAAVGSAMTLEDNAITAAKHDESTAYPVSEKMSKAGATIVIGTVDNTGFAPTTTEFETDDITEGTADHYKGRVVIFTSGALQDQATDITVYALAGGRGHFTVTTMTEAPGNDDTFVIV